MNLTKHDAWALARVRDGHPIPQDITGPVMVLAASVVSIPTWSSREWLLRSQLTPAAFAMVQAADSEEPPPALGAQTTPPTSEQRRRWGLHPADYLRTVPAPRWLLQDRLPDEGLSVLYGPSGAYKTFVGLDWALQVAQRHRAIYTIYEGRTGYWPRIQAWERHTRMSHKGPRPDTDTGLFVVDGTLPLMDQGQLWDFIATAEAVRPKLIVIDTLARAMTGSDENSTRDMGLFVAAADAIRQHLKAAVLIVHHSGKGGPSERGSSALRGAADMMIRQWADEDGTITQECDKSKDAEPFDNVYLRPVLVEVQEGLQVPVLMDADRVLISSKLTPTQRKVLDVLTWTIFEDGATSAEILDASGISRGSLYRVLNRLLDMDLIGQESKRTPYKLTSAGRDAAAAGKPQALVSKPKPAPQQPEQQPRSLGAEFTPAPDYYEAGL